jgi:hypothetical protein
LPLAGVGPFDLRERRRAREGWDRERPVGRLGDQLLG